MKLYIFDVEHGGCALLQADTGALMLIDCGHNSHTGWRPSSALPSWNIQAIDLLVVTNYDEDHVSDLVNLRKRVNIGAVLTNKSVSPDLIKDLKSETGMGNGISELCNMLSTYTFTQSIDTGPSWGNLTREVFYNYYPSFDDENNLSLILSLHCNNMHVMFTGDLEKAGWLELLKNERFKNELRTINVFVASHHGRENGCCEEVFKYCKPEVVIISDGPHQYETQKTVGWYSQRASGIRFDGKPRRVFSTRSDGYILIESTPEHTILDTQKRRDKVKAF